MTNLRDCNGTVIKTGDIVRDNEGFAGRVLFINGAWRYDVDDGRLLKFNSSLLFKEGIGTGHLEVIAQPSRVNQQQEADMLLAPTKRYESTYTER